MDSGVYCMDEDTVRVRRWARDAFLPTNFAFLDDDGFLLADGYGSDWIHRYDKDANWVSKFGGPGEGEGKFNLPHGIWIDRRPGSRNAWSSATGPTTSFSSLPWRASTLRPLRAMASPPT